MRARDSLKGQLRELSKQKPRSQTDENLLAETSRLEAGLTVARDDLVGFTAPLFRENMLGMLNDGCTGCM